MRTSKIEHARTVAEHAHGDQTYAGIYPYMKHLEDVVDVLRRFGQSSRSPISDPSIAQYPWTPTLVMAAYLHDTLEDTLLSYSDIRKEFGERVAEIVYAVTNERGRNRKERHEKTYPKILADEDAITLKIADRIANIEHGGRLVGMYRKEWPEFSKIFESHIPPLGSGPWDRRLRHMWDHLTKLMTGAVREQK